MDAQALPRGTFTQVEMLAGGTQNILVRFERGGRAYVLRRPPKHLRKASNDVIRRLAAGDDPRAIVESLSGRVEEFAQLRAKYLLYP